MSAAEALRLLALAGVHEDVALLGVRGYYLDTMGAPGANDRGIYDDAIMLVSPTAFATFNANTDPSIRRPGVAVLMPGVWFYEKGRHKRLSPLGYPALTQAAPVRVLRDGGTTDVGWFGINIHRGSRTSTSSLGCQTIWPEQWEAFRALVYGELDRHGLHRLPYCLIDEGQRRAKAG
jgi:hypothetical protein